MTIGLLITVSALQIMLGGSKSSKTSEHTAYALEHGRQSLRILSQSIRRAGYRSQPNLIAPEPFYTGQCEGESTCTKDGGGINSDRLAIQYEPTVDSLGSIVDCTGTKVPIGELTADVYFVAPDPSNHNINTLFCRGYDPINEVARGSRSEALIPGVERIQVLYGLEASGSGFVNRYITADDVTDWRQIQVVRVAVLVGAGVRTPQYGLKSRTYNLLYSGDLTLKDKSLRYIFSTATRINNSGI